MDRNLRSRVLAALASVLAASALVPLIEGWSWLIELLVVIVVAVGVAALADRFAGEIAASAAGLVALVLMLQWTFAADEAFAWLIPTPTSLTRLVDLAVQGREIIENSAAPAPDTPGLRLLLVGGLALAWWLVDLIAVMGRRPALAGLPLLAVYCLPVGLVPSGLAWWWFVPAAVGYLALIASDSGDRLAQWGRVVSSRSEGRDLARASIAGTGRRVGVLAVAAAVLVPSLVPGLDESLLPFGDRAGDGPGTGTISVPNPILELRDNLNARGDAPMLRYTTDDPAPDPLRLVTVDSFDGDTWKPTYGTLDRDLLVSGGLPAPDGLIDATPRTQATTTVQILGLRTKWLPAPYPPQTVDIEGGWLYDPSTLNIVGDEDLQTDGGMQYSVGSLLVEPDPAVLDQAGPADQAITERWTALPEDLPAVISQTAAEVVAEAGAVTQLEQATALQDWFRSEGGFRYDTDAPDDGRSSGGSSAVADFLQVKRGYCVHFASAMALMTRSLGIPTRVAVGWLPGEQVEPGIYEISQQDMHAWPELYFEGAGWLRFEPTPASRSGTLPSWAAPQTEEPAPATPSATASATPTPTPSAVPTAAAEPAELDSGTTASTLLDGLRDLPWRALSALLLVLTILAAPAVSAVVRRRRRWSGATTPPQQAEAAWTTLSEGLDDHGITVPSALTVRQASGVVGESLPDDARAALSRIRLAVESSRYAPDGAVTHRDRQLPPDPGAGPAASNGARGGEVAGPGRVAVLERDDAGSGGADLSFLRDDAASVVKAAAANRPTSDTWRARLWPRSGLTQLRSIFQRVAMLSERVDDSVSSRMHRTRD